MNVNEERDKKAGQLTELLISRTDFRADVARIRESWRISDGGFKTGQDRENWYNTYNVHNDIDIQFKRDISKTFIKSNKYGLTAAAWKPLLHYIMDGKVPKNFNGALPVVTQAADRNTGRPIYTMQFYEHTSEAEVRKAFGEFKAKNFVDKRQQLIPETKLKRMQRAHELRASGMQWKQVADTINQELDSSLNYSDARKLVEQYKKHIHA